MRFNIYGLFVILMACVVGALDTPILSTVNFTADPDHNTNFYFIKPIIVKCSIVRYCPEFCIPAHPIPTSNGSISVYENGILIGSVISETQIYKLNYTINNIKDKTNYTYVCVFQHSSSYTLSCVDANLFCNSTHIIYNSTFYVNTERFSFDDSLLIFYNLYGHIILPFFIFCMTAFVFRGNVGTTLLAFSVVSPLFYLMFNNPAFVILGIGCVMVGLVFKYFNI